MHPDLALLLAVDTLDRELRRLEASRRAVQDGIASAESVLAGLQAALADLEARRAANREQEHALSRKLHLYRQRRESAQRVLEGGGGDPMAAERQVAQCEQILDDTETELLGAMEVNDALARSHAETSTRIAEARAELERLRSVGEAELARLAVDEERIAAERAVSWTPLPADLKDRYAVLVQRKGTAVARLVEGACGSCRIVVHQQHVADLRRGIVVPCRGCGRWLVTEESTA